MRLRQVSSAVSRSPAKETIKMPVVSSSITPKRIITLTDRDYQTLNNDLNLNFKRLGIGIKSIFQLYFNLKLNNNVIDPDKELFIPTSILKKHSKRNYQAIRSTICHMKGFSDHKSGKCDLIVAWKDAFAETVNKILLSHRLFKQGSIINRSFYNSLPGADWTKYSQKNSSGRHYISHQNLCKAYRSILFKGCDDIDIQACWSSIFLRELHNYINNNNIDNTGYLSDLMPLFNRLNDNDKLLQDIINDDIRLHKVRNKTPRKRAKAIRSRLFNHKVSSKTGIITPNAPLGCEWYDDLATAIYDQLLRMGIYNSHLYFSTEEQKEIQKVVNVLGKDQVLLNMHDGLILTPNTISDRVIEIINQISPYILYKHCII